jgi:two-component system chemotaxis sensor kinase CheA
MLDYNVFDSILDAAFVVDADTKVLYCNDAAATFCASSVRRLIGKALLSELIALDAKEVFPFNDNSPGRLVPSTFLETGFHVPKADRRGKVQLAIRPINEKEWLFYVRDVSLEEALHSKYRSELIQKEGYIGELEQARAKLEDYSKNLEKLVEARTAELQSLNLSLNAILNSLGQGFFIFDQSGVCGSVYTRACETILGVKPEGKNAWDILAVPEPQVDQFKKWLETAFAEYLPFEDIKGLGPSHFPNDQKKHVTLEYYPIRNEKKKVHSIVVVATDRTAEHEAQIALEEERQYAGMIVRYIRNRDQFQQFLASVKVSVGLLQNLSSKKMTWESVNEAFRILHTLEGEAGTFSVGEIKNKTREIQHWLEPFKTSLAELNPEEVKAYSAGINGLSETYLQFLVKNQDVIRMPKSAAEKTVEIELQALKDLFDGLKNFAVPSSFIEPYRTLVFQEPIANRLGHYDGLLQSIAQKLGKKMAPLKIVGGELRVNPERYQKLFSGFVHAFRNAVDHGIEMPDERGWIGKPEEGQISIEVEVNGSNLHIQLKDDGKGIDPSAIRKKLKEKFPKQDFSTQDDSMVIQNVFMAGFSSREEVGEFSGRGVGLDALKDEVEKLNGRISVISTPGQGTTFEIVVPTENQEYPLARSA